MTRSLSLAFVALAACHGGRAAGPTSAPSPRSSAARVRPVRAAGMAEPAPPAAPPLQSAADLPARWWEQGDAACPDGGHLVGAPPPDGMNVSCKRNQDQHGPYVWFYPNGAVYQLGIYKDGRQEGEWVSYHDNGSIASRTPYVGGQYQGEEVSYHTSGKLAARAMWKESRIVGNYVAWYESGVKSIETPYKDGVPHGTQRSWNDRGQLMFEANYDAGQQHGVQTYFHDTGHKRTEQHYDHGSQHGTCRQWSPSGTLLGSYDMDHGTGTYTEWHDNGVKSFEMEQRNGSSVGFYRTFFDNGQLSMQGEYKDGSPIGEWLSYQADGSIARKDIYTSDGQESIEYERGKMKKYIGWSRKSEFRVEGEFVDDQRHGTWAHLDSWGDVRQVDIYKRGKLVSSKQKTRPKLPAPTELAVGIEVCDNLLYRTLSCEAVPYDQRRSLVESAKWWKQTLGTGNTNRAQVTEQCRSQAEWVPPELAACTRR